MANTVVKRKLLEGSKRAIFHFYLEGDGSGEFNNEVLINPVADFDVPVALNTQLTITKIWYGSALYDAVFSFNAVAPVPSWVITADQGNYISFDYFGGLSDQSAPDGDGKILLSTSGFNVAGTKGSLIIEVKKD